MLPKALKYIVVVLLTANGLFFMANIAVLGDTPGAVAMHEDLAPWAGPLMAQLKVVVCFLTGAAYAAAAAGLVLGRRGLVLAGPAGAALFLGFYAVELVLWGGSHAMVWLGFAIFGTLALVLGAACLQAARGPGIPKEADAS